MRKKFNRIFLILFTAILFLGCNNLEKSKTEEKYKQIRMAEGLAKELNKNPELIDVLDTQELKGKTEEEIINAKASAINKIYNDYLKEHGYKGKPIVTIVTDVTDPNGNFYMNEDTNEMVVDKQTLLKMTKDDALYNIGHEFGHYSVADDKATKDQTVGKFVGNYVEEKTKELKPKKATKDTWEKLSNNLNLITGAEAKKRAEAIPMEKREYKGYSFSVSGSAGIGGAGVGGTEIEYRIYNPKTKKYEVTKAFEGDAGMTTPKDIGISASYGYYFIDSYSELEGASSWGGSINPALIFSGINNVLGITIGGEVITKDGSPKGVKFYIGKSLKDFDVHYKKGISSNIDSQNFYTPYEYNIKYHPRGWRNGWK